MCQNSLFNVIPLTTDSCSEGYSSFIKVWDTFLSNLLQICPIYFQDLIDIDNVTCKVVVYLIFKAKPPPGAK